VLRDYLQAYMKILKNYPALTPIYVDAFAGTGYRSGSSKPIAGQLPFVQFEQSEQAFLKGSARIALEIVPSFGKYIFVELNGKHAAELQTIKLAMPDLADRMSIVREDANEFLQRWCAETDWKSHRAVVFLDPYGTQVEWPTIQCLARTEAVDLWYLFPLSAVNRLLTNAGKPRPSWVERLNHIYGCPNWVDAFYPKRKVADLFGDRVVETKDADFSSISDFTVSRLKSEFPAVAANPRILLNDRRSPLFLLCFAAASRKASTQRAALNIASHILKM
jgi:three-Cys-motif partner protein